MLTRCQVRSLAAAVQSSSLGGDCLGRRAPEVKASAIDVVPPGRNMDYPEPPDFMSPPHLGIQLPCRELGRGGIWASWFQL